VITLLGCLSPLTLNEKQREEKSFGHEKKSESIAIAKAA
jgi:hypothetical protein